MKSNRIGDTMPKRKNGKVLVQISIPEEIYQILRKLAYEEEVTVNQMIVKRLTSSVSRK